MARDRATGGGGSAVASVLLAALAACTGGLSDSSGSGATVGPPSAEGAAAEAVGEPVTLARLIDGDSMELTIEGAVVEVRLLGVNAPELRTVDGDDNCNGGAARSALEDLLAAGDLRFDAGERDRFDRVLGVLWADGRNLNRTLVADGWALGLWSADDPELVGLMQAAAGERRGLWGDTCGPAAAGLELGDIQADAPGPDDEHLDQEWVELANATGAPVDLAGWSLADETTSNRFALPAVELAPGAGLRVVTGPGPDDAATFHLHRDDPVWNNRGETVLLVDPAGRVAAHRFLAATG